MYVASHPEATFLELHKDDFDARVPIVLDGTPEAAEESLLMLAIARGVDATGLDKRRYVDVLATLKDLAALVHWDKMKVKRVLLRLEDQHRVFLRKEPRRVFKSKTVIQVGVGNHRCLFAPVLSPEYLFNESLRAFWGTPEGERDKRRQIRHRMEEHLARIPECELKTKWSGVLNDARQKSG